MKLNNKRTILVGLAFLSICAFWQMYDSIVPLILTKTFHMNETFSGAIMAADNILALFLLPFFGSVSDKSHSKLGKRMPFILFGTGCAIILMNILPLLDNSYAAQPSGFKTASFVIVLGLLLVAMGTYRAPAVALMPDVTPKPLRSRANAIINLMGAVGGILYLGVAAVLYPNSKTAGLDHVNYQPLFIVVSAIMFVAVAALFLTIREPKLTAENQALEKQRPEWNLAQDDGSGHETLPKPVKKSLGFLLASIALWFIGYNGVTTWFSTYVDTVMGQGLGGASTCLLIATAGAIVSYIPIGQIASKIGRKRTIVPAFLFTGVFGLMYAFQTSTVSAIIVGFLLMMCLYVLMASVVAVYAPELFATKVRFRCVGFANAVAKLLNVLMPMVVGWMLTSLGATSIFVAISAIAIASMLIVGFFGAETAQKSVG